MRRVETDNDLVAVVENYAASGEGSAFWGVGCGSGVAGNQSAECGADGMGEHAEHDVDIEGTAPASASSGKPAAC